MAMGVRLAAFFLILFFSDSSRSLPWCLLRTVHMLRTGHQQGLGSPHPDLEPHGYVSPACFPANKVSLKYSTVYFYTFILLTLLSYFYFQYGGHRVPMVYDGSEFALIAPRVLDSLRVRWRRQSVSNRRGSFGLARLLLSETKLW